MATIRKRGKYWHVQVIRRGYPAQYSSFDSKAEAENWALHIESQMKRSVFVSNAEAERTTLEEALTRYRDEITIRKKGAKQESSKINVWLARPIVKRYLASLRSTDFAAIRDEMREAGRAENTIRLHLAIISHLFETARKEWGMEALQNPIQLIRKPGNSKPRDRRLDKKEQVRLLAACRKSKSDGLEMIVRLALETAARLGELLSLQWELVNLRNRTATLLNTKNGEDRHVPLSANAVKLLRPGSRSGKGRVFPQWKNDWSFEHAWRRAVTKAEIDDLRFHDLRHEATSRFFERGLNPMEVAAITGHKTFTMLKRYTHLRASDLARKLR